MAVTWGPTSAGLVERLYAIFGLLYTVMAFEAFFLGFERGQGPVLTAEMIERGSLMPQIIGGGIYFIALLLLVPRYRETFAVLTRNKILLLFVAFIVASAMWSTLPPVSLRRSLALSGTTIFAIYLAVRFPPQELLRLLGWALAILAVETLAIVIFMPHFGIESDGFRNYWVGGIGHKNDMGRIMVLGALVLWMCAKMATEFRPIIWAGVFLCLFLVAMSQSATSWIVAICLALSIPMLRRLRKSEFSLTLRLLTIAVFGIGGLAVLVLQNFEVGLEMIGRDTTLTGRTLIWEAAIAEGEQRPLLGYGYRTFWTRGYANPVRVGHGHNSFLDLWLELGFVGFSLFLVTFLTSIRRAFWRLTNSRDVLGLWYPLFLTYMFLFSITAQVFPDHGTIAWVLYVTNLLYLSPAVPVPAVPRPLQTQGPPPRPVGSSASVR